MQPTLLVVQYEAAEKKHLELHIFRFCCPVDVSLTQIQPRPEIGGRERRTSWWASWSASEGQTQRSLWAAEDATHWCVYPTRAIRIGNSKLYTTPVAPAPPIPLDTAEHIRRQGRSEYISSRAKRNQTLQNQTTTKPNWTKPHHTKPHTFSHQEYVLLPHFFLSFPLPPFPSPSKKSLHPPCVVVPGLDLEPSWL